MMKVETNQIEQKQYIQARLIAFLYENVLLQVIISPILAFFVVWVFKDIHSPHILAIWFVSVCIAFFLRYLLYRAYLSANPTAEYAHVWGKRYALLMITAGSVWGVSGYFFYSSEHLPETMMLVIVLAGLTAGSFISHSAYLLAYIIFPIFAVIPLSIRFYIEAGEVNIILGTLCLVYIFILFSYANRAHRYLKKAVQSELKMKELNEKLVIQKEKAEYANIAKSKFLAVASHDLRQPLHAIQLFTSALEMESSEPSIKSILTNITNATDSLSHLFNNLLDLSMVEAKTIRPTFSSFPLNDFFQKLQDEYEPTAWAKDLDFRFVKTSVIIWSDPLLVERIIRNLLENAIRYTNNGAILIGCRRKTEHVRLDIYDTGLGISNDDIENIFNEFITNNTKPVLQTICI